jgi:hypothetical protein
MKHLECIVSIFQMKDKHQWISTIVPFMNSVWTYSNLWIDKDWMFHGYACGGGMSLQWSFPIFLALKRMVVLIVPFVCRRKLKKLHLLIHILLWHQLSWVFSLCQIWLLPESTCCKCSSPSSLGCLVEWILLRFMLKGAIKKALLYNSRWFVHLHFLTRYSRPFSIILSWILVTIVFVTFASSMTVPCEAWIKHFPWIKQLPKQSRFWFGTSLLHSYHRTVYSSCDDLYWLMFLCVRSIFWLSQLSSWLLPRLLWK